jgi:hypothetical protein
MDDAVVAGCAVMVTGVSVLVPRVVYRARRQPVVVAVDASGGGTGATVGAVAPLEVPAVTLESSAASVQAGTVVTLSGRVTGTGGRALADVHVLLRYRPAFTLSWVGVPLTTSADGSWSILLPVHRTSCYVAIVTGVPDVRAGAASPEVTVTVS